MIYIFNNNAIQQNKLSNIHEMNPTILIIKTLIQKPTVNYHYLQSTIEVCDQLEKYSVNYKIQTLYFNRTQKLMCVRMKPSNHTHELAFLWL